MEQPYKSKILFLGSASKFVLKHLTEKNIFIILKKQILDYHTVESAPCSI